jgi:hypothetical protein
VCLASIDALHCRHRLWLRLGKLSTRHDFNTHQLTEGLAERSLPLPLHGALQGRPRRGTGLALSWLPAASKVLIGLPPKAPLPPRTSRPGLLCPLLHPCCWHALSAIRPATSTAAALLGLLQAVSAW